MTMSDHPCGRRADKDPDDDEELIRRVAARQSARLRRPVPINLSPAIVRRGLVDERDAMMIAVAVLRRAGAGVAVPDAIDVALEGATPGAAGNMPYGVAAAVLDRVPARHQPAVWEAVNAALERFESTPGGRYHAELCVFRIADATRAGLADSIHADVAEDWAGAIDHGTGQPFTGEQMVQAATATADTVAIPALIERLQADLIALAGLP